MDRKYCDECKPLAAAALSESMKGNQRGTLVTEKSRAELVVRMKGNTYAVGHSHPQSEETKKLNSDRMMGNKLSNLRTPEGIAAQAQYMRDREVTDETKARMSAGWFKSPRMPKHKNLFAYGDEFYRSRWECAVAHMLTSRGLIWDYETTTYVWKKMSYTPDFFVYDQSGKLTRIIEVKGHATGRDYLKHKALKMALPGVKVRMWTERHMQRFGLLEWIKSSPPLAVSKSTTSKPPRATSSSRPKIVRVEE
jgi:hypothetical protein